MRLSGNNFFSAGAEEWLVADFPDRHRWVGSDGADMLTWPEQRTHSTVVQDCHVSHSYQVTDIRDVSHS